MVVLMSVAVWAYPNRISYQGMLTDLADNPLDGEYNMKFRIHYSNWPWPPELLWVEEQNNVKVENGIFNVELGAVEPISYEIFNRPGLNQEYTLQVLIYNEDTLNWEDLSPWQERPAGGGGRAGRSGGVAVRADTAPAGDRHAGGRRARGGDGGAPAQGGDPGYRR